MEENNYVSCPNCGGTFRLPGVVSAVKCPYCGYTVVFQDQSINGVPVFFLPARISRDRILEVYIEELNKQVGVPENLVESVKRSKVELYFVPMAIFEVNAKGVIKYGKYVGDVCYADSVAVSANPKFKWLDGIHIPTAGRIPFDPTKAKNVKIVDIKDAKDFSIAEKRASNLAKSKLRELALRRGRYPSDVEVEAELKTIVYYPIYSLEYSGMNAVLEGVEGEVILGMYNPKAGVRFYALSGCCAIIASSFVGIALSHTFWPIVVGVAGILPLSRLAIAKRRLFGLKAEENIGAIVNFN